MKRVFILLLALSAPLLAQQGFDFKSLDKLDALATHKTKVDLNADTLKLLGMFFDGDKTDQHPDSVAALIGNLKGVYVRTYEFNKDGQYSPADVEPFRAYLKQQQWSKIVESQEGRDLSEIYIQPGPNGRFGGVAIVDLEPRELTVVYINGLLNRSDIEKLQGDIGIPGLNLRGPHRPNPSPAPDKKKNEEEREYQR